MDQSTPGLPVHHQLPEFTQTHVHRAGALSSLALTRCTDFFALGHGVQRGGLFWYFLGGSDGKVFACNAGDPGSIPGLGRSPGEGNGNPLQYSSLL